jgi:hypothetical protein
MTIADDAMAARAGAVIARWGGPAQLVRNGVARDCIAGVLDYKPGPKNLRNEEAETVLVKAPVSPAPDHEQDELVKGGQRFAIVAPIKGPRPGGTVIFYWLECVYVGPA